MSISEKELLNVLTSKVIRCIVPDKNSFNAGLKEFVASGQIPTPNYSKLTAEHINKLRGELGSSLNQLEDNELDASQLDALIQARKKEINMLEAALRHNSGDPDAGDEFVQLAQQEYGHVSKELFLGLLTQEREWVIGLNQLPSAAEKIRDDLLEQWPDPGKAASWGFDESQLAGLRSLVEEELGTIAQEVGEEKYGPQQLIELFNRVLDKEGYAKESWRAVLDESAHYLSVSVAKRQLIVSPLSTGDKLTIQQKALHEIGVHIRRSVVAEQNNSPLLEIGLDGYLMGEEGLGIAVEVTWAGTEKTQSIERAVQRYLWQGLGLGLDGSNPRDFAGVYELAWRRQFLRYFDEHKQLPEIEDLKFNTGVHVFRAFRGTNLKTPGVLFTRDHVYLDGYLKTMNLMLNNPTVEFFQLLLSGKFNHTDVEQLEYARKRFS